MVKFNSGHLDSTFRALSDATRRAIVARLAADGGEMTVTALAAPFEVSLPAIMKHLKILCAAGLVTREKRGRSVHCRLNPAPLENADAWLEQHTEFWRTRLDQLEHYLEER